MKKPRSLEEEAKLFSSAKITPTALKPPSARVFMIGLMASALLSRSNGPVRMEEIKREACEWADYILGDS